MILYNWLKIIHVISASVLFGTGMATAFHMLLANKTKDIETISIAIKNVVSADWIFTGISGVLQPVTGLLMIWVGSPSITDFWVIGSIIGYSVAALCWFPVVYIQIKLRKISRVANEQNTQLPPHYHSFYKWWLTLGWPAFISLIIVFFLMANRPESFQELIQSLKFL